MTHPATRLDDAVHQRTRLGILAVLCEAGRVDFSYLRQTLQLTDGNLSRNLTRLQDAGYITVEKLIDGRRPRTWLSATSAGRRALDQEIVALREIIATVNQSSKQPTRRPLTEPT